MTIRFLVDENFDHKTLSGIKRRDPDLDIVAVQDVGLREVDDSALLEWAAQEERIVVTHDVTTFSDFAYERVAAGLPMPGVIEIPETVPRAVIIDAHPHSRRQRTGRVEGHRPLPSAALIRIPPEGLSLLHTIRGVEVALVGFPERG